MVNGVSPDRMEHERVNPATRTYWSLCDGMSQVALSALPSASLPDGGLAIRTDQHKCAHTWCRPMVNPVVNRAPGVVARHDAANVAPHPCYPNAGV